MFGFGKLKDRLFTSKYHVGDRVVHAATRRFGKVVEVQWQGKTQRISVDLDLGGEMRLLDRREFQLATKG